MEPPPVVLPPVRPTHRSIPPSSLPSDRLCITPDVHRSCQRPVEGRTILQQQQPRRAVRRGERGQAGALASPQGDRKGGPLNNQQWLPLAAAGHPLSAGGQAHPLF